MLRESLAGDACCPVDYDAIDDLLKDIPTGPTAAEYRSGFKKPAASPGAVQLKRPSSSTVSMPCSKQRKLVYSRGYHAEGVVCKKLGLSKNLTQQRCRRKAQEAVSAWQEDLSTRSEMPAQEPVE